MKNIIFLYIILLGSLSLSAQSNNCITVHMKDGSFAVFPIEKKPCITFEGQTVTISDEHWQISNVRKYTIENSETTGIVNVGQSKSVSGYAVNKGEITIRLADKTQKVRLYTLNGIEIPIMIKPDQKGIMRLSLPQTDNDVFLLNIGNETLKIRRP